MVIKLKKVTVIMAVHNGERYLSKSVASILNQSLEDFEFLIVDDGSTDGTAQILGEYVDDRIRVVRNESRRGLTRSLNLGLSSANSEFIARQDADDISLRDRLESQISYLCKRPQICVLGTNSQRIDSDGARIGLVPKSKDVRRDLLDRNPLVHGSVMFRREPVAKLGGYDEFFYFCQDYELWQRIARHHEIEILSKVHYLFRQHGGNTRLQKGRESTLYQLLVRKIARETITDSAVAEIKRCGLSHLMKYLDSSERAFHCKAVANMHMWNGRRREAVQSYIKAIRYSPLQAREYLNLTLACLGPRIWRHFHSN